MTKFNLEPSSSWDKALMITGPNGLLIEVDYDDVDHDLVDRQVQRMIDVLNAGWHDV